MTDLDRAKSYLRDIFKEENNRVDALLSRLERLLTGGNAGGIIASLSLIGTQLRDGIVIPSLLFWLCADFALGLFLIGVSLVVQAFKRQSFVAGVVKLMGEPWSDVNAMVQAVRIAALPLKWGFWIRVGLGAVSGICLTLGVIFGLLHIYSLTCPG